MIVFIALLLVVVVLLYKYFTRYEDYWKKRNVPYKKQLPIIGDKLALGLISFPDEVLQSYQGFLDEPMYGASFFGSSSLFVKDPDLLRDILIKNFDHFVDRTDLLVKESLDPVLASSLLFRRGKAWKDLRSTLSPLFTGQKMRIMFDLVVECCQELIDDRRKKAESGKILIHEMKGFFTRLTSDIIATCAFGIKNNAKTEENNEFYMMAKKFVNFGRWKLFLTTNWTKLAEIFNASLVPQYVYKYFDNFVNDTIKTREKNNIYRPDMLQLMIQITKEEIKSNEIDDDEDDDTEFSAAKDTSNYLKKLTSRIELSDEDVLGQVLVFVLAGYETSSTVLTFASYELATNPEIQSRLQKEIDETFENCNGKITYEKLKELKYLDMVISGKVARLYQKIICIENNKKITVESLRKYPPVPALNRICTKEYKIKAKNQELIVEKGITIMIPIYALHHDARYFPNPFKFDPERFSNENKKNIKDFTYLPFGTGPRNCIGSRFALMQIKIALFLILSNFDLVVCSKTPIPMRFEKTPAYS